MHDSAALVSIVVPCLLRRPHEAQLLDETLETVDRQTWTGCEVVVVDDGSPLPAEPIARRHPRTRTVRQPNAGAAAARNAGIAASRGEYFVFLDADDHLLPDGVEAGLAQCAAHRECDFVVGPREEMTYEGQPVPWQVGPPPAGGEDLYRALLGAEWFILPPSCAMFTRRAVAHVGGFADPWGADDLDFYLRVARRFQGWCYQHPPVTRYRRYSGSSSRDGARMLASIRAVYARQRPFVTGDPALELAFAQGLKRLTDIFRDCLVENVEDRLAAGEWGRALRSALLLARESPARLAAIPARRRRHLSGTPAA